jgi:cytochrome b561
MSQMTGRIDYAISQKVVHWLMAFLIIMDLFIAQKFGGAMEDWDRFESRSDHASVGMVVTVLFLIRIYLRWKFGAPPLPATMRPWEQTLAHWAHIAFYAVIAVMILTGILTAMVANSAVTPFSLFALGSGEGNAEAYGWLRFVHETATKAIIGLIVLHVAAALYHLVWVRDGMTERMLRFWR